MLFSIVYVWRVSIKHCSEHGLNCRHSYKVVSACLRVFCGDDFGLDLQRKMVLDNFCGSFVNLSGSFHCGFGDIEFAASSEDFCYGASGLVLGSCSSLQGLG